MANLSTSRRQVRQLLVGGYACAALGAAIVLLASDVASRYTNARYIMSTVAYGFAAAAVAALTAHLPSSALNAGVRRAFGLTAVSFVALAMAQLFTEASYFDGGAPVSYKLASAAILLGSVLLGFGNGLWSREADGEPSPPE